jgi:hypothetical protein
MIAAAVKSGTKLEITDYGNKNWNEFVVNEIEKAGILIDYLSKRDKAIFLRLIVKAKKVKIPDYFSYYIEEMKQLIETFTEFPHLKYLECNCWSD